MQIVSPRSLLALASACAFIVTGVQAQEITGAGATFPAPLYAKWASDYNKSTGVKVNYQSIGSGGGIQDRRFRCQRYAFDR